MLIKKTSLQCKHFWESNLVVKEVTLWITVSIKIHTFVPALHLSAYGAGCGMPIFMTLHSCAAHNRAWRTIWICHLLLLPLSGSHCFCQYIQNSSPGQGARFRIRVVGTDFTQSVYWSNATADTSTKGDYALVAQSCPSQSSSECHGFSGFSSYPRLVTFWLCISDSSRFSQSTDVHRC